MDTNMEDKMYHQIEKSLSNNINENLFSSGSIFERVEEPVKRTSTYDSLEPVYKATNSEPELTNESLEYINQTPVLSRAEYIRQAREACLRQLSATQNRGYEVYNPEPEPQSTDVLLNKKKANAMKLFHEDTTAEQVRQENTPQEIASFRALIIRTVFAIVIFLSIFIVDKFEIKLGGFSHEVVREYVIGNHRLHELENLIVTWLK